MADCTYIHMRPRSYSTCSELAYQVQNMDIVIGQDAHNLLLAHCNSSVSVLEGGELPGWSWIARAESLYVQETNACRNKTSRAQHTSPTPNVLQKQKKVCWQEHLRSIKIDHSKKRGRWM